MEQKHPENLAALAFGANLKPDQITTDPAVLRSYEHSTLGAKRNVAAVLFPQSAAEVVSVVRTAARDRIPLYPISTGKNWGYGSKQPSAHDCVVVELSRMNRIVSFDSDLGLVTIEPGVTLKQLRDYLIACHANYVAPTWGAGPDASIVGNTLERGSGIAHSIDRFAAMMSIEAVLADGSIYCSISAAGDEHDAASSFFKWGVGPYLDGLFGQSGYGIVTRMTIALTPAARAAQVFLIRSEGDDGLEALVQMSGELLRTLPGVCSFIRVQSPRNTYSRLCPYVSARMDGLGVMEKKYVEAQLALRGLSGWVALGVIRGDTRVVRVSRKVVRQIVERHKKLSVAFFTTKKIERIARYASYVPSILQKRTAYLPMIQSLLRDASGGIATRKPNLPFWNRGLAMKELSAQEFDADPETGFLFFSIVLPIKGKQVREIVDSLEAVCVNHGIEPLLALNSFSDRSLRMSLPILFDRSSRERTVRAWACYRELCRTSTEQGAYVYRTAIHPVGLTIDPNHPFWRMEKRIKRALDPDNIMSPGRYSVGADDADASVV